MTDDLEIGASVSRERQSYSAPPGPSPVQHCPFCGEPESERFALENRLYIVFPCMFTARVAPGQTEEHLATELATKYGGQGGPYFRRTCDALHLYVTNGAGATVLRGERESAATGGVAPPEGLDPHASPGVVSKARATPGK